MVYHIPHFCKKTSHSCLMKNMPIHALGKKHRLVIYILMPQKTYHSQLARMRTCGSPSIFFLTINIQSILFTFFTTGVCNNHSFNLSQYPINFLYNNFFLQIIIQMQTHIHACTLILWTYTHSLPL